MGSTRLPGDPDVSLAADQLTVLSEEVLVRCDVVARFTEEPGKITRTFLCEPMRLLHEQLRCWMQAAGMQVRIDAIGNVIGHFPAQRENAPVFLIGSHIDSVPNAGKYDGVLGLLLGIAAVHARQSKPFPFAVHVLAFSEEEGIRYETPYLGSSAVAGKFDSAWLDRKDSQGISMAEAIRRFGLDPAQIPQAAYRKEQLLGYLEVHIEQGPVLESLHLPLGIVEAIVGQSRAFLSFIGKAGHAGTLPMELRQDALTAAAEFILAVERKARTVDGLRATVGTLAVDSAAINVVPGCVRLSLDIRHALDSVREASLAALLNQGVTIASERGVQFRVDRSHHHAAVQADPGLTDLLASAVQASGRSAHQMVSGAGHDAAVLAGIAPMTMLFIRSPGGISHHPEERVLPEDVRNALEVMIRYLETVAIS